MRPIEVGDWVECVVERRDGVPKRALVCSLAASTAGYCAVHRAQGLFCQADILQFVGVPPPGRAIGWGACCFVPIFPRLCEETTDASVKAPANV